jgi:DNA-binding CsgD family transcriptional regulator
LAEVPYLRLRARHSNKGNAEEPMTEYQAHRNEEMERLRAEGKTFREIGERYGVSGCRVRQIIGNQKRYRRWAVEDAIRELMYAHYEDRYRRKYGHERPYEYNFGGCYTWHIGKSRPLL